MTMKVNNLESTLRSRLSGSQSPKLTNIRITPTASQTNFNELRSSNSPIHPYTYTVTSAPTDEINNIAAPSTNEKNIQYSQDNISPIMQRSLDSSKEQSEFATLPKNGIIGSPPRPMTAQGKRNNKRQHPNLESNKVGIDMTSEGKEEGELLDTKKRVSAVFFDPTDPILELPVIDRM